MVFSDYNEFVLGMFDSTPTGNFTKHKEDLFGTEDRAKRESRFEKFGKGYHPQKSDDQERVDR